MTDAMETLKRNNNVPKLKKRRERDRKRAVFFCIGYSHFWPKPIPYIIKKIKKDFPTLSWLRISMSYHRFTNLRELFQGDLSSKLTANIVSLDFMNRPCNCRDKANCPFDGKCRHQIIVYQATDTKTGELYTGQTQREGKKRKGEHDTRTKGLYLEQNNLRRPGVEPVKLDSFNTHFIKRIPDNTPKEEVLQHVKASTKFRILWQGNPISCVKTFGTRHCQLCMKERLYILRSIKKNPKKTINACNEIYGACRHNPKFHRFDTKVNASTDESDKDERVTANPSPTSSVPDDDISDDNNDTSTPSLFASDTDKTEDPSIDPRPTAVILRETDYITRVSGLRRAKLNYALRNLSDPNHIGRAPRFDLGEDDGSEETGDVDVAGFV